MLRLKYLAGMLAIQAAICSVAIGQDLTDLERENIKNNTRRISNDSAMHAALTLLGTASFQESGWQKRIYVALEILKSIEGRNLLNDNYYSVRAVAHMELKDYETAIRYISKAIQIDSKQVRYYRKRAECKMSISNYYGAIPDITKALSLTPNDDALYGNRAVCYMTTEQWTSAMTDVQKAIAINSNVGDYYLTRGTIHGYFGRKKESCLDYSTAGDLGDERAFAFLREACN